MSVKLTVEIPSSNGPLPCTMEVSLDTSRISQKAETAMQHKLVEVMPKVLAVITKALEKEEVEEFTSLQAGLEGILFTIKNMTHNESVNIFHAWNCPVEVALKKWASLNSVAFENLSVKLHGEELDTSNYPEDCYLDQGDVLEVYDKTIGPMRSLRIGDCLAKN